VSAGRADGGVYRETVGAVRPLPLAGHTCRMSHPSFVSRYIGCTKRLAWSTPGSARAEPLEDLKPWVDVVLGVVVHALVQRQAADDAQSGTVRAVQRGDGFGQ
jgi:hypothetical protein